MALPSFCGLRQIILCGVALWVASPFARGEETETLPCDHHANETWNTPEIDPPKQVAALVAQGWTTISGEKVLPIVKGVTNIRPDSGAGNGRMICRAIVETDHGTYAYLFWITYDPNAGASTIRGQLLNRLDVQ